MATPPPPTGPIEVFFSFAHEDEPLLEELVKHLGILKRRGVVRAWHDREITAGTDWKGQIDRHLDTAGVVLLLVSSDFVASDYCWDIELARALERHDRGEARVIPVILRPVDNWQATPFGKLGVAPTDGRPVTSWPDRDEAFADVSRHIRRAVEDLRNTGAGQGIRDPAPPGRNEGFSDRPDAIRQPLDGDGSRLRGRADGAAASRSRWVEVSVSAAVLVGLLALASLLRGSPPWPDGGIIWVLSLLGAAPAFLARRAVGPAGSRRLFVATVIVAVGVLLGYTACWSALVYEANPDPSRFTWYRPSPKLVGGFILKADVRHLMVENVGFNEEAALSEAGWDPFLVWEPWTVRLAQWLVLTFWLALCTSLVLAVATFPFRTDRP